MQVIIKYNSFTDEFYIVIPDDLIEELQLQSGDKVNIDIDNKEALFEKNRYNILGV